MKFTSPVWRLALGKLRILSGKEICNILKRHGFSQVRQRGSHIIMQKDLGDTTVTVPVPNYTTIGFGTLQCIIRQSGISKSEFEC